jgi:hypothetical protein
MRVDRFYALKIPSAGILAPLECIFDLQRNLTPRRFMNRHSIACASAAGLLLVLCGKPVIKQAETVRNGHDIVRTEKGDTTGYIVSFRDSLDRKKFSASLDRLLKEYPFRKDTLVQNQYFRVLVASSAKPAPAEAKTVPAETLVQKESPAVQKQPEKIEPRFGGSVTMYVQRGFADEDVAALFESYALNKEACQATRAKETAGYFKVKSVSDRDITLALDDKLINGGGRTVSSFDCVNAWNAFVKNHPAEGAALFLNVKGLTGFIRGQEAIVPGFQVVDDKTIVLHLDPPDPQALTRMCTPRLLPADLKLGPYMVKSDRGGVTTLVPNSRCPGAKPYLASCTLRLGRDPNPILAYSLNRYDIVALFAEKDLDYARRKAMEQSNLVLFSEDRYFLSCALDGNGARLAVRNAVNPRDILANFVKAEGSVLQEVETDNAAPLPAAAADADPQAQKQPVTVLYRSDDPISAVVGEKIVADLTRAGLQCAPKPAVEENYEASLVRRDYGIAVGWVPKSVLFDESERLRLASLWFAGAGDEHGRLVENREIPLFSVKEYLLCKKKIGFAGDALDGIFVVQ